MLKINELTKEFFANQFILIIKALKFSVKLILFRTDSTDPKMDIIEKTFDEIRKDHIL